jgi:hypothetical protein
MRSCCWPLCSWPQTQKYFLNPKFSRKSGGWIASFESFYCSPYCKIIKRPSHQIRLIRQHWRISPEAFGKPKVRHWPSSNKSILYIDLLYTFHRWNLERPTHSTNKKQGKVIKNRFWLVWGWLEDIGERKMEIKRRLVWTLADFPRKIIGKHLKWVVWDFEEV